MYSVLKLTYRNSADWESHGNVAAGLLHLFERLGCHVLGVGSSVRDSVSEHVVSYWCPGDNPDAMPAVLRELFGDCDVALTDQIPKTEKHANEIFGRWYDHISA